MGRIGRPSRIYETFREGRCGVCDDWIREPIFRAHVEREHPEAWRSEYARALMEQGFEIREVRLPDRIVELVAAGNYLEDACGAVGIRASVVYGWISIGKEWEEPLVDLEAAEIPLERRIFRDFSEALAHARAEAVARNLRVIERAGTNDWKARAWILERTHPDRFGRQERLRIGGDPEAGPIRVTHEETDPDFIDDVMQIYRRAGVIPDVDSADGEGGHPAAEGG